MLALILCCGLGTHVEYFPPDPAPAPPPAAQAASDPARALLEDPSPQNARAFLQWRQEQEERLRAALAALEMARTEKEATTPDPARRRTVRPDLLSRYRRAPCSPRSR